MNKKKLFIGIEIPPYLTKKIFGLSSSLQKFGYPIEWIKPEKFHLTLIYLGYLKNENVEKLIKIIYDVASEFKRFHVELGTVDGFPSIKNPRIIMLNLSKGTIELANIYNQLKKNITNCGFKVDEKEFRGHVTLGRVKSDDFYIKKKISELMKIQKKQSFKTFCVSKISLFESVLIDKEFNYNLIMSAPLEEK